MGAGNQTGQQVKKPGKRTARKVVIWVIGIVLFVIVLLAALVPFVVSSGKMREMILNKTNASIDGRLDFSDLSMSWFRGIRVSDISFRDGAGRTSVAVKEIATKPHYASIILGNPSFGRTVIDEPKVQIEIAEAKVAEEVPEREKRTQQVGLAVSRIDLVVNDGNVKVSRGAEKVELSGIGSEVRLRPVGQVSSFEAGLTVKGGAKESKVSAAGEIKPSAKKGWGLEGTNGELSIEVNELDLESLGVIFALAGLDVEGKGVVSATLDSEIEDGALERLEGVVNGAGVEISGAALKGDVVGSSKIDAAVRLERAGEVVKVEKLSLEADWLSAEASGVAPMTVGSLSEFVAPDSMYELEGSFTCDVARAMSQLWHTLGVKEGMQVTGGKVTGKVETVTEQGSKKLYGQASLEGLEGVVDGKRVALSEPVKGEAKVSSEQGKLRFDNLGVRAAFAKMDCMGTIDALQYSGNIDLGRMQAELGEFVDLGKYSIAGEVSAQGRLSVTEDKVTTAGTATAKQLKVTSQERVSVTEPSADISFGVAVDKKRGVASIERLDARAGFGRVAVSDGVVPFGSESKEELSVTVSAEAIELSRVQPYLVMFGGMKKDFQMGGRGEGRFSISSEDGQYTVFTDSTKLTDFSLVSPGEKPFVQKEVALKFDAGFNPQTGTRTIRNAELVSPNIKIKGRFEQVTEKEMSTVEGQAELDYDWSAVSAMVSAFMPGGLKLEGQRKDRITFASRYDTEKKGGLLENLKTGGQLGFEKAEFRGLGVGATDVAVKMEGGVLEIAPFETTVNKGKLRFGGGADFRVEAGEEMKTKPVLFKLAEPMQVVENVEINEENAQKLLMYVNPIFANATGVSGVANFSCEELSVPLKGGSKNDIELVGTISLEKVQLQPTGVLGQLISLIGSEARGQEITVHPTEFTVQNGVVSYDNMQVDIGNNPVNFQGVIGLDERLDMTVILPYTSRGRTVRTGEESEGRRISIPLKGTLRQPEFDVQKFIQDQAIRTGLELLLEKALE